MSERLKGITSLSAPFFSAHVGRKVTESEKFAARQKLLGLLYFWGLTWWCVCVCLKPGRRCCCCCCCTWGACACAQTHSFIAEGVLSCSYIFISWLDWRWCCSSACVLTWTYAQCAPETIMIDTLDVLTLTFNTLESDLFFFKDLEAAMDSAAWFKRIHVRVKASSCLIGRYLCLTLNPYLSLLSKLAAQKGSEELEFAKLKETKQRHGGLRCSQTTNIILYSPKTQGLRLNTKHILN